MKEKSHEPRAKFEHHSIAIRNEIKFKYQLIVYVTMLFCIQKYVAIHNLISNVLFRWLNWVMFENVEQKIQTVYNKKMRQLNMIWCFYFLIGILTCLLKENGFWYIYN